jgi:hypothetical protein
VLANNNIGLHHSMDWLAPADGTFYLRIASLDATPYTINMRQAIDDQLGHPADITLPALITGAIDFNIYQGPRDDDFFRFQAVAGKTYVIVNNDDGWADMSLLDENFARVRNQPDYIDVSARWTAPATGTYYFKVYGMQLRRHQVSGPYSFSLLEDPDQQRPNKPILYDFGQILTGQFHYRGDERKFTLDIPARGRYRLLADLPVWSYLHIDFDAGSYEIPTDRDGKISKSFMLQKGDYTIHMYGDPAGPFTFLADLASNFNSDPGPDDEPDTATDGSEDDSTDDESFYSADLYVDDSNSSDAAPSVDNPADAWLDESDDPLDSSADETWA